MQIRAITTFVRDVNRDKITEYRDRLLSVNLSTMSRRISLPPTRGVSLDKITDSIPKDDEILYSMGGMRWNDPRVKDIPSTLQVGKNFFLHILLDDVRGIEDVVKLLGELEPEDATRFAVLIHHEYLATPYFPTSSSTLPSEGFSLSLLYVKDFQENRAVTALKEAKSSGMKVQEESGMKFLGVDPSLSPWMNESVGNLLESITGAKLFHVGVLQNIYELNQKIQEFSYRADLKPIGFSEVMLPVAEDDILKERALDGSLTLTHLAYMSTACAAGIDMVGLVYDREVYKNVFRDAMIIQKIKERPYAIRIIPSRGEEKIHTQFFGFIPVVKVV